MSEPTRQDSSSAPVADNGLSLGRILELALFLRILAAIAVEWFVRRGGSPRVCVFPDAEYYWILASTIGEGRSYEIVEWGDIPHFALRTPGYPLFLAVCRLILGDQPLGARLAQTLLGTLSVWLVYRLTRELPGTEDSLRETSRLPIPLIAALLTAVHPYFIVISALLLSEAVFVPLLLAALWGMAVVWNRSSRDLPARGQGGRLLPLSIGVCCGAAILVRPSWALFVPIMICAFCYQNIRDTVRRRVQAVPALKAAGFMVLGLCLVMTPWWVRNARVFGRFVPTAVWMGASLYDGLNPSATGSSDMRFLAEPEFWPLGELDQDRRLTRRALEFAREHPGRVLELAVVKLAKYWSPWPVAEDVRSWPLVLAAAMVAVPLLGLMGLGLWTQRRDARAWVLLAGPLIYFCGIHLIFASSMRYRIPAEAPAMGLAASGLCRASKSLHRVRAR